MNLLDVFERLRSRPALVALTIVGVCALGLARAIRPKSRSEPAPLYAATNARPVTSVVRDFVPIKTVSPAPPPELKPLLPLKIHVALPPETNPPALSVFAPAGRMIRAVTVNTIDSASIETPIIALVVDSLYWQGKEIIPAGSELHGRARVDRLRDRIVASGPWTIVWQNGEELTIDGIALDRDDSGTGRWGQLDGTAGLSGQVLKSDSRAEIKLFISTFISGASGAFQETQNTIFGAQARNSVRNAGIAGGSEVLNRYAQQIAETIRRDGVFVRVPAGKQLYLYTTHTLDRSQAKVGNLRVSALSPTPSDSPASEAQ